MKILVTGGTGSLGSRLVHRLIHDRNDTHDIIVYSRDEQKQFNMRLQYESNIAQANSSTHLRFVIGNIQDINSVRQTVGLYRPDIVIHTAAQKHVRVCDENPEQAILTNIIGTSNLIEVCNDYDVQKVCFVSTDKAVEPTTTYGMTKAIAERVVMNATQRPYTTQFVGVRYGNVVNSAGSLIPLYQQIAKTTKKFIVTHKDMTRFFISFQEAIDVISVALGGVFEHGYVCLHSIDNGVFRVPKIKSAQIIDIAELFAESCGGDVKIAKPYPTEKIHEKMSIDYCSSDHVMQKQELKKYLESQQLL